MLTLAQWAPWIVGLMVVGFVIISCSLMIIILLQKPQGGGLSEAFGASGGGAGNTAFGARVGDALTTATIVIFIAFLAMAITLNFAVEPSEPTLADQVGTAGAAPDETAPSESGELPDFEGPVVPAGGDPFAPIITTRPAEGAESEGIEMIPINPPQGFGDPIDQGPTPTPPPSDTDNQSDQAEPSDNG